MEEKVSSRYDDPRWYEERDNTPPPTPPTPPAFHTNNTYPTYTLSEDDPLPRQQFVAHSPSPAARRRFPIFAQVLLVVLLMVITFFGGWFGRQLAGDNFNASDQSKSYSQLFDQAWSLIDKNYVDRSAINYKNMSYAAIQAMVDSLKDYGHTRFLTPQQVKDENQQLSGTFVGIGIYVGQNTKNQILITEPIPGSPGEKIGIRRGDVILAVNSTSTSGKSLDDVTKLLQGNANTSVTLTLFRPTTQQTVKITVTRAQFTVKTVVMHYIPQDHIADITYLGFDQGATDQLKTALTQAKKLGATKIVLDLRGNGGGYLSEAIDTASLFIKSGNVLQIKDNMGGQPTPMAVNGTPQDTTSSLVVLVNNETASAAEIVSGALQDNKRAVIMGEKTFGTGTILQQFPLADGSAILIGIQEWLTPNGKLIRQGITPNVTVAMNADGLVLSANDENSQALTLPQIGASGDNQLEQAIKYLESH